MEILIKRLSEQAVLPSYGSESSSGIDICSIEEVTVNPGQKVTISTGVAIAIPVDCIGFILDKKGYFQGKALEVEMSVVDSSYRQEIMINFINNGDEPKVIGAREKIAQLLIQKVEHPMLIEAEELS